MIVILWLLTYMKFDKEKKKHFPHNYGYIFILRLTLLKLMVNKRIYYLQMNY